MIAISMTHFTFSQIVFKQIQTEQGTSLFATNRLGINEIYKTYDERDVLLVDIEILKTDYEILSVDFSEIKKELNFEVKKTKEIESLFSEKIKLIEEDHKTDVKMMKKKYNKRGFVATVLSFLFGFVLAFSI